MNWDDLRIFLAISRATSLSGAARDLGVNQSTVSRRLKALEDRLQTTLIERGRDGYSLSAAGEELFRSACRLESEVLATEARLAGCNTSIAGPLRVTCADILLEQFLAPHIADFVDLHPNVELEIVSSFSPVDIMRREADVAIRVSAHPPEVLVGRRLMDFAMAVYANQAILNGVPENPPQDGIDWIGWISPAQNRDVIADCYPNAVFRHRSDGMVAIRALVRAGVGVSVLPCYWADADETLTRVYPDPVPGKGRGLWVLAHPDIVRSAKVRAFTAYISGKLLEHRAAFEGHGGGIAKEV